jgi:type VI secretion system secreted protein Hcp
MDLILLQPGDQSIFGAGKAWEWDSGESLIDDKWRDDVTMKSLGRCVELVSVHQGLKQQMTTDVSNSARTSGRPIISEFTCVKYADKISVKLYDLCLRAKPLGSGKDQATKIYICRNSGEQTSVIMTMALRDAMISEIQFQSHPNDMPTEQFKLNFTEILWQHTVQIADASIKGQISSGWSLARNRPLNDGSFT